MNCVHCENSFDESKRSPRLLVVCGHSICETCLYSMKPPQQQQQLSYRCRACQTVNVSDVFPKNLAVLALLKTTSSLPPLIAGCCTIHENKRYEAFCMKEKKLLCIECVIVRKGLEQDVAGRVETIDKAASLEEHSLKQFFIQLQTDVQVTESQWQMYNEIKQMQLRDREKSSQTLHSFFAAARQILEERETLWRLKLKKEQAEADIVHQTSEESHNKFKKHVEALSEQIKFALRQTTTRPPVQFLGCIATIEKGRAEQHLCITPNKRLSVSVFDVNAELSLLTSRLSKELTPQYDQSPLVRNNTVAVVSEDTGKCKTQQRGSWVTNKTTTAGFDTISTNRQVRATSLTSGYDLPSNKSSLPKLTISITPLAAAAAPLSSGSRKHSKSLQCNAIAQLLLKPSKHSLSHGLEDYASAEQTATFRNGQNDSVSVDCHQTSTASTTPRVVTKLQLLSNCNKNTAVPTAAATTAVWNNKTKLSVSPRILATADHRTTKTVRAVQSPSTFTIKPPMSTMIHKQSPSSSNTSLRQLLKPPTPTRKLQLDLLPNPAQRANSLGANQFNQPINQISAQLLPPAEVNIFNCSTTFSWSNSSHTDRGTGTVDFNSLSAYSRDTLVLIGGIAGGEATPYDSLAIEKCKIPSNPSTNASWTVTAGFSGHTQNRMKFGSFLFKGKRPVIFGGYASNGSRLDSFEELNFLSSTTSIFLGISLTRGKSGFAYCQLSDESVMIAGGNDSTGFLLSEVETYNLETRVTRRLTSLSFPRDEASLALSTDANFVYIFGGYRSDTKTCVTTVERYDIRRNEWLQVQSMRTPRRSMQVVSLPDGIYVLGGFSGSKYCNEVEKYDDATNSWVHAKPMKHQRATFSALPTPDLSSILVFGGFDGKPILAAERYSIFKGEWEEFSSPSLTRFMHSSLFFSM